MAKKRRAVPSRSKHAIEELPDAELEVLACLWQQGEATAAEIRSQLSAYRPMGHGSVLTLLKRLTAKELVRREKGPVGKAFVFRATHRPKPTYHRILKDLTQRIFGGNRMELIASLLEFKSPTKEELKQLKQLLDALRQSEDRS